MPREYGRNQRIAELVQREVAGYIQREESDPRLKLVTVSRVDVSPDLANARLYVTSLTDDMDKDEIVSALNEVAPDFRRRLAGRLTTRGVPRLKFYYDHALERANRLSALIDSLSNGRHES